jgi:cytochrome d ubiquinol oxidase subunit I
LEIGGIPNDQTMQNDYGIQIPRLLSIMVFDDTKSVVTGLDAIPRADWPNTRVTHWMFDLMVGAGFAMLALAIVVGWTWWRTRSLNDKTWLLRAVVLAGPLGFVALEAGWIVTEVGRQPWIIYKIMRTSDAVTPMPNLFVPFGLFTIIYAILAVLVLALLRRQFLETSLTPYGSKPHPEEKA